MVQILQIEPTAMCQSVCRTSGTGKRSCSYRVSSSADSIPRRALQCDQLARATLRDHRQRHDIFTRSEHIHICWHVRRNRLDQAVDCLQICYFSSPDGQRGNLLADGGKHTVHNPPISVLFSDICARLQVPDPPPELKEWSQNTSLGVFAGLMFGGGTQWLRDRQAGTQHTRAGSA